MEKEIENKLSLLIPGIDLSKVKQIGENGMSNLNYLYNDKIVRIPIDEYTPCVDRKCEKVALELLIGKDGISLPEILLNDGTSLRNYVKGEFLDSSVVLKTFPQVEERLNIIHSVDASLHFNDECLDLRKRSEHFFEINDKRYQKLMDDVNKCFDMLDSLPKVFSHGDIMPFNIIVGPDLKVSFIDFEYVCMAPAIYDVACLGNMGDKMGLFFLDKIKTSDDSMKERIRQYYMCRLIQTFNWMNVAEFKANVINDDKTKNFFWFYADDCFRRIEENYLKKIF